MKTKVKKSNLISSLKMQSFNGEKFSLEREMIIFFQKFAT